MKLKPLLILFSNIALVNAQLKPLTGSIIDSATNRRPVANATIRLIARNLFYPADDKGEFNVSVDGLTDADSIGFSCIGYRTKKLTIKQVQAGKSITLSPMVNALTEVKIGYKQPQLVNVGSRKHRGFGSASFLPNMVEAMFMPGSAKIGGAIKSVGFSYTADIF